MAEHWFEKKMGLTKRMAEHILSEKPETSKEQLKNLTNSQKSKTHSRSDLDAIYEVGKELGVSYPDDLVIEYDRRKKQEAYENRVREKTGTPQKTARQKKTNLQLRGIPQIYPILANSRLNSSESVFIRKGIQYTKFDGGCSQSQSRIRLG